MQRILTQTCLIGSLALSISCKNEKPSPTKTEETSAKSEPAKQSAETKPKVKAIPDGYHTITPTIHVKNVKDAVDFYTKAFGANLMYSMPGFDGKSWMHAQVKIDDSMLMIGAEHEGQSHSPESAGGVTGSINIHTKDASALAESAVAAGATLVVPVELQFWGDDWGRVKDPFGHLWDISTQKIQVPGENMQELAAKAMSQQNSKKKPLDLPGEAATHWKRDDWTSLTPVLNETDVEKTMAFYKTAFNAEISNQMTVPGTEKLMHAEVKIGDSIVMISEAMPEMGSQSPADLGGKNPMGMYVYVEDADAAHKKAVAAHGKEIFPVMDMFWGDRLGFLLDPSGHGWSMASHVEDLSPEQMDAKMKEQMKEFVPASSK